MNVQIMKQKSCGPDIEIAGPLPELGKVFGEEGQFGGKTVTGRLPLMAALPESATVNVIPPVEVKVTPKVPTPLESVELEGRLAVPPEMPNCTIPGYPVAVLLNASKAVTV